jgi:pilus assembly protein TadC
MKKLIFVHEFGKAFIPRKIRPELRRYLLKAGITEVPYGFFGALFYVAYLATFLVYFFYFWGTISSFDNLFLIFISAFVIWVGIPLGMIALLILMVYAYLDIRIFNRTRKMEDVLPDFLQEVSSNLKGGLSFEKALWMSIKPRFGIMSNEIAMAAKKVMTGHDVEVALREFAQKYNSNMLKRSINLITGEIKSGGKISDIIDRVVHNLKRTKALKDEMNASVITYMIFISAVVIFISPILFGLAFNLLIVIQKVTALLATSAQGASGNVGMLTNVSKVSINKAEFIWFSKWALLIIAFFSSLIVSIIEKGSIKGGVKYIPIFIISSYVFYLICLKLMTMVFSTLIAF